MAKYACSECKEILDTEWELMKLRLERGDSQKKQYSNAEIEIDRLVIRKEGFVCAQCRFPSDDESDHEPVYSSDEEDDEGDEDMENLN